MMLRSALVPMIACLGAGLVFAAPAFAQEADELEDMTFEQKLVHQLMTGLGATNGRSSKGINYRERSPLVLPPQLTLPPPQTNSSAALAPNWPKDPDEQARKAQAAAASQPRPSYEETNRQLMPNELAKGRAPRRSPTTNQAPGEQNPDRALMPNELGYRGGLFGSILTPQKEETATFTGEPPRATLTEPPAGYQTPSPNYAYGIGVAKPKQEVDPNRALPPGKF